MRFFNSCAEAMASIGIDMPEELKAVETAYPVYLNSYYLSLIDCSDWRHDPVALQAFPHIDELADRCSSFDPLAEEEQMPVNKLIHRFRDRVVVLTTGVCAMRCRFCFRKREWAAGNFLPELSDQELADIIDYLRTHSEIREVLLSGGDPLMLPFERLLKIVREIKALPNIDIVRIGTRIPVVYPQRITFELAQALADIPGLWIATHFNHPKELTPEALQACKLFISNGIPVVNQTVLLKNVNDSADILEELFRKLVANRIKPHYLFHVDPVRGVRHFATGIGCGLDILRTFRSRLSSLAVPTFAIDLPQGGGKVALQPDYCQDGKYPDIHDQKLIAYETRLPESGSCKVDL